MSSAQSVDRLCESFYSRWSYLHIGTAFNLSLIHIWARIEQVIRNLLMNAVVYSPPGASITVWSSLDPEKGEGALHIADTGMGIAYKEQKRIFERFYRVDKARSRSSGGTGLGLAIAKEIMEMHQGRIELDSIPGKGSTFHLIFVLSQEEAAEDEEDFEE